MAGWFCVEWVSGCYFMYEWRDEWWVFYGKMLLYVEWGKKRWLSGWECGEKRVLALALGRQGMRQKKNIKRDGSGFSGGSDDWNSNSHIFFHASPNWLKLVALESWHLEIQFRPKKNPKTDIVWSCYDQSKYSGLLHPNFLVFCLNCIISLLLSYKI
jgi:hypothetical protein